MGETRRGDEADPDRAALELTRTQFEADLRTGLRPRIEDAVAGAPATSRPVLMSELLALEWDFRLSAGERPTSEEYRDRLHRYASTLELSTGDEPARAGPDDPAGLGMLGAYRVRELLGAGGMGAVYRADDPALGRSIALKVMRGGLVNSEAARQRFFREARAAAALQHDHVVPIYQVGQHQGTPYLVMPLLSGQSLSERLKGAGRLPLREALRIGREVAEGLAAAHERGLIHRDIKPGNIWLEGERGRVKILDFGLVRVADEAARLTADGDILGTPAYMAPEQARGGGEIDARCDLFSLGAVLYRMTTGRSPFAADSAVETLAAVVFEDPAPLRRLLPGAPAELEGLVHRLLAKSPADRPPTAVAVVRELHSIEAALGDHAPLGFEIRVEDRQEARPRASTERRGRRLRSVAVAAALLAALAFPAPWAWLIGYLRGEGMLVVETRLPRIVLEVRQEGRLVAAIDASVRPAVSLRAGSYELALPEGEDRPRLSTWRLTLKRGERRVVTVSPAPIPAGSPAIARVSWPVLEGDDDPLTLTGLVARPAPRPGAARWQAVSRRPRNPVSGLAWSPDGKSLACASGDRFVRVYDPDRLELIALRIGHEAAVNSVAWAPDGRLAAGDRLGKVLVWDADGRPGPPRLHRGNVAALAWSPVGGRLAVAGEGAPVQTWDEAGALGPELDGHAVVLAVTWSPDGHRLATGCRDGAVRLWQADGAFLRLLKGHVHPVRHLSWSRDGRTLASADENGSVRLWGGDGTPGPVLAGHIAAFRPDGHELATDAPGSLRLWSPGGTPARTIEVGNGGIATIAWDPVGTRLAAGGGGGDLRVLKLDGSEGPALENRSHEIRGAAWGADGRLATGSLYDGRVRLWEADGRPGPVIGLHAAGITCLAWEPGGRRLVSGSVDGTARVWGVDGQPGPALQVGYIRAVAWSRDGRRLATTSSDARVRIWEADGRPVRTLDGHSGTVTTIGWGQDGRLASGSSDGIVRVWKADGSLDRVLGGMIGSVVALSWSRDGRWLAYGGDVGRLVVLDPSGRTQRAIQSGQSHLMAIAWHPDGVRLAAGHLDSTVRLWGLDGGEGPVLHAPDTAVAALDWSPDGTRLVIGGENGMIRTWRWGPRALTPGWTAAYLTPSDLVSFRESGAVIKAPAAFSREVVYAVARPDGGVELRSPERFEDHAGPVGR